MFYVQAEFSDAWMEDGLLEPLDPYLEGNPEFTIEPFYDQLLSVFQLDGKTYGLPKDAGPLALFYNTDMLTAAGVQPPTTWDELTAAAKALTKDGVAGLCVGPELPRVGAFIYQAGGGIYNEDKTELTITSPESVAGHRRLPRAPQRLAPDPRRARRRLVRRGIRPGEGGDDDGRHVALPAARERLPRHQLRRRRAAAGRQQGNLSFTNAYGMGVDSANKEAGWVLLQYLAGPEGMGKWTSLGLALPAREDVPPARGPRGARRRPDVRHRLCVRPGLRRHPDRLQQRAHPSAR